MYPQRTDLALEAQELWQESAQQTTKLHGVKAAQSRREGYPLTRVDVLNERGATALGKPVGSYRTIDLSAFWERRPDFFPRAARAVGQELRELLQKSDQIFASSSAPVLVVGLGNPAMTPDAVGPLATEHILVTRHLIHAMPKQFAGFRPVSVFRPGVLGTTGVESAESVKALVDTLHPQVIIVIDALAARRMNRLCNTIQISNTGIIPGSGVGNSRQALNQENLGVPVLVAGIPTVVDAATLALDLLRDIGLNDKDWQSLHARRMRGQRSHMTVTPRDIDAQVKELSRVIGYGINWALQDLEIEDIAGLLG